VGTVLVVQPDPELSEAWTGALVADGHDVLGAGGVREAIGHIREGGVDVVVVDAYDPRDARTGITELVGALERLPDAPPLILVSGLPNAPELSARIGAAGFVPKPCEPADVCNEVLRITGSGVRPLLPLDDEPTGPRRFPTSS
jgi:DNA-binding NtrC family response regulator